MPNDITVVLTLYKRPYNLEKQFEAIENQTIKPDKIILFQDKTTDGSIVEIPENIKNKFDDIKIASENIGVWGRFNYARSVKTKYVCIFDDDTIPGEKWLENCLNEMNKQEGLYGTNGVLMYKAKDYPYGHYHRIGWYSTNKHTIEVDFVGHSWFLKTQWLEYMFDNTEDMQKLKYAGEDMTLSAKLLEHGIKTFVPPHPINNKKIWGSLATFGIALGKDKNSLCVNPANLKKYNDGMMRLLQNGLIPVINRNNEINKIHKKILFIKRITWLIRIDNIKEPLRRILFSLFNI